MTKLTLLAAASVAAITFAGAAQAGTITGTISTIPATAAAPFTIASERTNAVNSTGVGGFVVTNTLVAAAQPSLAIGAPSQTYSVTFDITGGTIPTVNAASVAANFTNGTSTGASSTFVQGARSANSIQFIVTVTAPTGGTGSATLTGFTLTTQASNSAAEANIAVGSTTSVLAGGVSSQIDATPATTLVVYAPVVGAASVTSRNALAALPDFKLFSAGPAAAAVISNGGLTAEVASDYTVAANVSTGANAAFYAGLDSNATITRDGIISGATVTITGSNQFDKITAALVGATPTATVTNPSSVAFTLDNTGADLFSGATVDLTLSQTGVVANQVAIAPATLTTAYLPTFATGYTAPTAATSITPSGTVALDGVNFIAPWTAGSQAPNSTVIRLSNGSSQPSGAVTLRLLNGQARAAGVTTGPGTPMAAATCTTTFSVPAGGELQLTKSQFDTCFGAFLRGDIQITIQSAATTLTAKARSVDASGATFEQSLGRFSGSAIAGSAF